MKVAVVEPAATATLAGAVAALWLLARVTTNPPVGAADPRVTVPVVLAPPSNVVGFNATLVSAGALMVREAFKLVEESVAVIEATVWLATARVETEKVVLVEPAGIVTLAGTVADA